ncbi:MAG: flagellar hook assembly protein FlgD [Pseudomonadota bacterium]
MTTIQDAAIFEELGLSRAAQAGVGKKELGQEDFLMLMTTQLRNQDPFKPMENGEFLSQLAQFGTVNGIDEVRSELQNMTGSLVSNQSLQAAAMLGRQVLVPGSVATLAEEGEIGGAVDLPNSVAELNIGIYDLSGQLIRNVSLGNQSPGMVTFNWDGLATDGSAAPPGRYEIRAEGISGGANAAYDVMLADTVRSVTLPAAGKPLTLELASLGEVGFSDIRQIR